MKKLYLFSVLIFLFACEKENAPTSEYITYEFKIVTPKNLSPLANFYLFFKQRTWIDYRTFTDSILEFNKTDNEGNVSFTFKASAIINKPNVHYGIQSYIPDTLVFDSTNNNFKYYFGYQIYNNEKINIKTRCSCSLRVTLAQDKYLAMGIDSLCLETPIEKYMNKDYTELYYIFGNLECSESVPLKYYYYTNGIKSKEYTKNIFISRSNEFTSRTNYELEF